MVLSWWHCAKPQIKLSVIIEENENEPCGDNQKPLLHSLKMILSLM